MTSIISQLPVYDECFASSLSAASALKKLENKKPVGRPDFSIRDSSPPKQTLGRLASLIMCPLYPAQSPLAKRIIQKVNPRHLNAIRSLDQKEVERDGTHFAHKIILQKNGVRYHGLIMGRKENLTNGKWVLQAMGRDTPIERAARACRNAYSEAQFNLLMINGPSIGRSEGKATPLSLGEAHEAGLCFLENAIKAKEIAIAGHSMGGAVTSQAILQHKFQPGVQYLVIRQSTFDRISNVVRHFVPFLKEAASKTIIANHLEMDSVLTSQKLQDLGIKEVIIQSTHRAVAPGKVPALEDFASDGVIAAHASLAYALVKEKVLGNKLFVCVPGMGHQERDKYLNASIEALTAHFSKSWLERLLRSLSLI